MYQSVLFYHQMEQKASKHETILFRQTEIKKTELSLHIWRNA